jgi:hypothetical protein
MPASSSPAIIVSFTDTLTTAGTATINITLPAGSTFIVKSVTLTGTNSNTTATVTANSGATAIVTGGAVGNAIVTFITSTSSPISATNNLRVVCAGVGGTITGGYFTLVSPDAITFTSAVS